MEKCKGLLQKEEHYVLQERETNDIIVEVKRDQRRKQRTQWLSFVHNIIDLSFCPKRNGKPFVQNALRMLLRILIAEGKICMWGLGFRLFQKL